MDLEPLRRFLRAQQLQQRRADLAARKRAHGIASRQLRASAAATRHDRDVPQL